MSLESKSKLQLPPVVFGTSSLGNLFQVLPDDRKLAIVRAWFESGMTPVVVDSAGKYGAGLALEQIGRCLRELSIDPTQVAIGVKYGWYRVPLVGEEPTFEPGAWFGLDHDAEQRISREGILQCWRQSIELLGEPYRPKMISVHDPDEYLTAATDEADYSKRLNDILEAYVALREICADEPGCTLGVGTKDWRVARTIAEQVDLDWVMLANCVTAYTHEPESLTFIATLAERGTAVINSGVFNAGFLVGGAYFDYRLVNREEHESLFAWRDSFNELCQTHGVFPAHACIQFGVSPPGVRSVALSSTHPDRVAENNRYATTPVPDAFWAEAKRRGLIDPGYEHVGSTT